MAQYRKLMMASSIALAISVSACGGGGGGGIASAPPPPATPTPTPTPTPTGFPAIVAAAATSQEFASKGASYTTPLATYDELDVSNPSLSDSAQLDVRYNATSRTYEVQLPADAAWQSIAPAASYPESNGTLYLYRGPAPDHVGVFDHRSNLQYSALLEWFTDTASGYSAIGIATLPGSVPVTGSAIYAGSILGSTSETFLNPWEAVWYPGQVRGSIDLAFNFGSGTLSGSINPDDLPALNFANTVYSSGSTTFSGAFETSLPGMNSFSGLFTGPNAQEVIGNFAFPYVSPDSGTNEQAAGAFVGRRP